MILEYWGQSLLLAPSPLLKATRKSPDRPNVGNLGLADMKKYGDILGSLLLFRGAGRAGPLLCRTEAEPSIEPRVGIVSRSVCCFPSVLLCESWQHLQHHLDQDVPNWARDGIPNFLLGAVWPSITGLTCTWDYVVGSGWVAVGSYARVPFRMRFRLA